MAEKMLPYRQRLAALFASFGILIMGTGSLTRTMSIDYYSVLGTLLKVVPSCIIMGLLGWVMGMILDQPRRRSKISYGSSYGNHFISELMKNNSSESQKGEEPITESI